MEGVMLIQANINRDIENNILYSKSVETLLSTAVIKNALGENIIIAWDTEKDRVDTMMNSLEKTANACMDKNIFIDDIEIESIENIKPAKKIFINIEKSEPVDTIELNNVPIVQSVDKEENKKEDAQESNVVENTGTNDIVADNVMSNNMESSQSTNNTDKKTNDTTKVLEENIKTYYGISTAEAFNMQVSKGAKVQKNGNWISATAGEIQQYFIPSQENINKYKFQFLNLASLAGISEADAKAYLNNKGILSGKEATFIEAAKTNNINEIYLMAHACLETGNGTSKLATGVNYKGTVVYNMFGIGAVDSNPVGKGAEYAYKMGWTTPEKAIKGGAEFISQRYINNYPYNQDTLYEMRWNPASPGYHQYATDIAWATKQAVWMEKIYNSFENAVLTFDIPVYRK